MTLTYTLRIVVPDEIDSAIMGEIKEGAGAQDATLRAKIGRYVGGDLSDAEDNLTTALPDGWYAAIDDTEGDDASV